MGVSLGVGLDMGSLTGKAVSKNLQGSLHLSLRCAAPAPIQTALVK